jgi:hypothetical protein
MRRRASNVDEGSVLTSAGLRPIAAALLVTGGLALAVCEGGDPGSSDRGSTDRGRNARPH